MTPPPQIKTIFWDIGGVLLTNGWDQGQRAHTLTPLGVNLNDFEFRYEPANFLWERGLCTSLDFFKKTVFHADQPTHTFRFDSDELWNLVCAESKVLYPEVFDLLRTLKSSGKYKLATLNNESRELNQFRLDAYNLRQYFDYFICSAYIHEMKPHRDIYRAAIEISGLPPASALFVDDKQENCAAATALGMNAIHFQSPAQLQSDLAQFGIQTT